MERNRGFKEQTCVVKPNEKGRSMTKQDIGIECNWYNQNLGGFGKKLVPFPPMPITGSAVNRAKGSLHSRSKSWHAGPQVRRDLGLRDLDDLVCKYVQMFWRRPKDAKGIGPTQQFDGTKNYLCSVDCWEDMGRYWKVNVAHIKSPGSTTAALGAWNGSWTRKHFQNVSDIWLKSIWFWLWFCLVISLRKVCNFSLKMLFDRRYPASCVTHMPEPPETCGCFTSHCLCFQPDCFFQAYGLLYLFVLFQKIFEGCLEILGPNINIINTLYLYYDIKHI